MTQVVHRSGSQPPELSPVAEIPGLWTYVGQTWAMRDFIGAMSAGTVKAEFENSLLGTLWLLINPLIMSGIYFLVFGVLFSARREVPNYTAYLIIGVLVYTYTARTTTAATKSLRQQSNLIQSVRFPRAVIPTATTVTNLVTQLPALGVVLAVAPVTGEQPRWTWLVLPLAMVLQTIFNLGMAMFAARLGFQFADMGQIVPHVMRLAMYLSGVMYGVERIQGRGPEWIETVFILNPFYVFMSLFRWALIDGTPAPNWWAALGYAVVTALLGLAYFRRKELEYGHA